MLNYKVFTFSYFFLQSYEKTREKQKVFWLFRIQVTSAKPKCPERREKVNCNKFEKLSFIFCDFHKN